MKEVFHFTNHATLFLSLFTEVGEVPREATEESGAESDVNETHIVLVVSSKCILFDTALRFHDYSHLLMIIAKALVLKGLLYLYFFSKLILRPSLDIWTKAHWHLIQGLLLCQLTLPRS